VRKISPPPGFNLRTVQPAAITIPTELSRPTNRGQKGETHPTYLLLRCFLSAGYKNILSKMRHALLKWFIFIFLQLLWQIPSWELRFPTTLRRISYWRFGTSYRSYLQGSKETAWPLKMGPIGCPETSVTNQLSTPHNMPEERKFHWNCDGSLQSSIKSDLQSTKHNSYSSQHTFVVQVYIDNAGVLFPVQVLTLVYKSLTILGISKWFIVSVFQALAYDDRQ